MDVATDGEEAQDKIAGSQYDLLLIDIRLPKVSGKEFYLWLLQEHSYLRERVIFMSGDLMGGDTTRFVEQTKRPLLPKSFTGDGLKSIVRETIEVIEI